MDYAAEAVVGLATVTAPEATMAMKEEKWEDHHRFCFVFQNRRDDRADIDT